MADLLVDVGNSRVKYTVLRSGKLAPIKDHSLDKKNSLLAFESSFSSLVGIERVYISNVAGQHVAQDLEEFCKAQWNITPKFAKSLPEFNGLVNAYINSDQLGVDRWLALIAASHCYKIPFCVVNCGTAVTIDAVDNSGKHLGGLILPGLNTMRLAINAQTDAIAIDEISSTPSLFGQSTLEAVSAGINNSITALIEKVCRELHQLTQNPVQCVLSGGDAQRIKENLQQSCFVDSELVFKGLMIYFGLTE